MSDKPANILFVSSRGDRSGGGENHLLKVMRRLGRKRFNPIVALPWEGTLRAPLEELDVEVIMVDAEDYKWLEPAEAWYRFLSKTPERVEQFVKIIQEKKIDLVHTNSNHLLDGALAASLAHVPHIYAAHIRFEPDMQIFKRLKLDQDSYAQLMGSLSTKIVAVSGAVAATLSPPVLKDKIKVIHNGLELSDFDAALKTKNGNLRSELGLSEDAKIISAIGRMDFTKGFDYYIESAALVLKQFPDTYFLLIGAEDNKKLTEELRDKAKALGIAGRFRFLGYRDDVIRILSDIDIFVLSSRLEGFPYVLLEAMACGCPIVATRCDGVSEAITDKDTGYLVGIGDINGMADAIISLIKDPQMRKVMGQRAREYAHKNFDADRMTQALMSVYDEVLTEKRDFTGSSAVGIFLQIAKEAGELGLQTIEMKRHQRRSNIKSVFKKLIS